MIKHVNPIKRLTYYFIIIFLVLLSGCAKTNFDIERQPSYALPMSSNTSLGRHTIEWQRRYPSELSAFYPLIHGTDALGARLRMIDAAEESIDLQYFLMKDDTIGALLSLKLINAANRGVRIRFLLDDIFTSIKDVDLFVLDQHENIEVRLFNPIARRGFRYLNYLGDFKRANRRMHNKSFTVDGCFTIVGGRNIADEYFSMKESSEFFDLDILAKGPIVTEVADSFDEFWNYPKSIPIQYLKNKPSSRELEKAINQIESVMTSENIDTYQSAINSPLLIDLIEGRRPEVIAPAEVISESPKKSKSTSNDAGLHIAHTLAAILLEADTEIIVFTPYLIPTNTGMAFWKSLVDKNITVNFITNSLASTNHVPVHAAYERYRKRLLQKDIGLYEVRPDASRILQYTQCKLQQSTLHTKLIVIDRRYVFIGSLNMDPRSIDINTEMGIMIDSKELAGMLLDENEENITKVVYHLKLNHKNNIEWHGIDAGEKIVYHRDPQTSWWRRFTAYIYKILPEGQL